MPTSKVPKSLQIWFLIHFAIDIIFAIPLLFFPAIILDLVGISITESITPRLVGAALMGIGGASFFSRNNKLESYKALLTLKIIWSISAIIGLTLSIFFGAPKITYAIILVFAIFALVWIYYKIKLN